MVAGVGRSLSSPTNLLPILSHPPNPDDRRPTADHRDWLIYNRRQGPTYTSPGNLLPTSVRALINLLSILLPNTCNNNLSPERSTCHQGALFRYTWTDDSGMTFLGRTSPACLPYLTAYNQGTPSLYSPSHTYLTFISHLLHSFLASYVQYQLSYLYMKKTQQTH